MSQSELESITQVDCAQPHSILGMHPSQQKDRSVQTVRAYLGDACSCEVVDVSRPDGPRYALKQISEDGFFEGVLKGRSDRFAYRLRIKRSNGEIRQFYDPYCFLPTLSDEAIYHFSQGDDRQAHNKLGAHLREVDGISGVAFSVWAPGAERVSVVGDFNHWDGRYHPMRSLGVSGIWELFIPGVDKETKYKFEIGTRQGYALLKTDPYGKRFEAPPYNAAIVDEVEEYAWGDAAWQARRAKTDWQKEPLSIYEMHLGSWKAVVEDANRPLNYRELAVELIDYLREMQYTHVEFMPLAEHPFDGSWGYQVTGFFAPTHRFGSPEDFMHLVDQLHQNGFGVIMDWVPAHFPTDSFALANFDGTSLYEHADPRQGFHQDWGTLIFNYGRNEVRSFLISSALAWCERYHIDGLRVDAVASMLYLDYSRKEGEWIPNRFGGRENLEAIDFLRAVNQAVHEEHPGTLMIAEESTSFPGVTRPVADDGLGFDFKWNMGWMHDSLAYMANDPVHRKYAHHHLSFGMLYQFSENFVQVYSHDEVVHGKASMLFKMPGEPISNKARQLRALYGLMWLWPGKKTLFMGNDFGQSGEWRYNASLDWHLLQFPDHEGIRCVVRDLNGIYRSVPSLGPGDCDPDSFEWINCSDAEQSTLSFLRKGTARKDTLAVVSSFTPVLREGFRIGVPFDGYWEEVFNSDAREYGGLGYGNKGGFRAEPIEWDGRPYSLCLTLPPHSTSAFRWRED